MTDNKPPRKATPTEIETEVLISSRRRCTLCYLMDGDLDEQLGQIAHLDDDRTNYALDNLAFMCMPHHSVYDGTNSQHKNYTINEVKTGRAMLYAAIKAGEHTTYNSGAPKRPPPGIVADRKTLDALINIMASTGTIDWLRENNFAGFSFDWSNLRGLDDWVNKKGPEHEFINAALEALRKEFHSAANKFLLSLATETFSTGNGRSSVPQEWEIEQPERFNRVVTEIHDGSELVCKTYDALVVTARRTLSE